MRFLLFLFVPSSLLFSTGFAENVLLFTIDSCRADRFGCYGYTEKTTPHIDTWAKSGTIFRNAYSTAAWTAPGLVSILSGLDPPTHGINNRDHMGSPDLVTLPKVFKERGFQVPNLNFFTFAPYYKHLGLPEIQRDYFGPQPGDELISWLQKNTGNSASSPFFLWYHTTMVHQPYNPDPADLSPFEAEQEKSPGIKAVMTGAIVPVGSTTFSPHDRPVIDQLYSAELRRVDRLFQRVLNILKDRDLLTKTLIILSADHGEELLDHGFVGHASTSLQAKLYEECLRIPLVISWPGKVPAHNVVTRRVSQTDIFPTVLQLFDIEIPDYLQGLDLLSSSEERPLFFESVIAGNQTTKEREKTWIRATIEGDYKYISTEELYNLKTDPFEKNNVLNQRPKTAKRLKQKLEAWLEEATALKKKIFPASPQIFSASGEGDCPGVFTPENGKSLDYDVHTGMILFDWSGDKETTYFIEYDIGRGDHYVAGTYEIDGNHQLLGPFPRELWENLKAWNPFKFRVSPKSEEPCWSPWVVFRF